MSREWLIKKATGVTFIEKDDKSFAIRFDDYEANRIADELNKLEHEIELRKELHKTGNAMVKERDNRIQQLEREKAELEQRLAAQSKNAERYLWLRHGDNDELVIQHGPVDLDYHWLPRNERLDAMIDMHMAALTQA